MKPRFASLFLLAATLGGVVAAEAPRAGKAARSAVVPAPVPVNDAELRGRLERECRRLAGLYPERSALTNQLSRSRCELVLPARRATRLSPMDVCRLCESGTVVIGKVYLCGRCDQEHFSFASGFVLSRSGAVLTSRHVVARDTLRALAVMTREGRVLPVVEVLAADVAADVAIMRVEGGRLTPVPLAAGAPVGAPVTVISHPDGAFFTVTAGLVSRYFTATRRQGSEATWMAITAPFAKGSSGAPVLDECGNAVGIVNNTRAIYYDAPPGERGDIQMVLDNCTPAAEALKLVRPAK